ncbi:hypothetical protein A9Q84_02050 [Halobacteriovorax marinus]|uniref:Permuted papain-like amidase enzyme, YaeF/YiiX, C92 family n=1 Tax=Halobacteriovorax marinus TaxID=97084 RepID=A0A1Y5FCH1_9BACT|nr:hypothetical protein A9Q84_02050 [Halobacteriovorax marinus]
MKRIIILSFSFLISLSALSTEFSKFEENLETIISSDVSLAKKHRAIYQHTLNLGAYGLEYIATRESGNGLFMELIKESFRSYILLSETYKRDLLNSSYSSIDGVTSLNSLFLIERTQSLYNTYTENKALRLILKDQSKVMNDQFDDFFKDVLGSKPRKSLLKFLVSVDEDQTRDREKSVIYSKFKNQEDLKEFANRKLHIFDYLTGALSNTGSSLSQLFGSMAGPIEWGDGGQLKDDLKAQAKIYSTLTPLDVIFEKKTFKLTDYTIPGIWGHNAVWLGTKEQLIELGIWEAKELDSFRERIEEGYSIFEMRRWGITFAKFDEWINMDLFASVRVKGILKRSKKDLLKIYRIMSEQAGKKYDFGFDADTSKKITCSEVIYLAYGDISWPIAPILGRETVSPNGMAESIYYQGSPVEFVSYVVGNKNKGAKFHTKKEFGDVMGFDLQRDGTYKQRYNVCKIKKKRNRRRGIKLVNKCLAKTRHLYLEN